MISYRLLLSGYVCCILLICTLSEKTHPMGLETSFVLASIASGLASICVVLALWSFVRLSRVEAQLGNLDDKLPPKRILELESAFDHMTTAFEGLQQKNLEWKQSVHGSVQRMDSIMRRNEKASEQLLQDDGTLNEDIVKAAPPEGLALQQDAIATSKQQALRMRWNKNRGVQ